MVKFFKAFFRKRQHSGPQNAVHQNQDSQQHAIPDPNAARGPNSGNAQRHGGRKSKKNIPRLPSIPMPALDEVSEPASSTTSLQQKANDRREVKAYLYEDRSGMRNAAPQLKYGGGGSRQSPHNALGQDDRRVSMAGSLSKPLPGLPLLPEARDNYYGEAVDDPPVADEAPGAKPEAEPERFKQQATILQDPKGLLEKRDGERKRVRAKLAKTRNGSPIRQRSMRHNSMMMNEEAPLPDLPSVTTDEPTRAKRKPAKLQKKFERPDSRRRSIISIPKRASAELPNPKPLENDIPMPNDDDFPLTCPMSLGHLSAESLAFAATLNPNLLASFLIWYLHYDLLSPPPSCPHIWFEELPSNLPRGLIRLGTELDGRAQKQPICFPAPLVHVCAQMGLEVQDVVVKIIRFADPKTFRCTEREEVFQRWDTVQTVRPAKGVDEAPPVLNAEGAKGAWGEVREMIKTAVAILKCLPQGEVEGTCWAGLREYMLEALELIDSEVVGPSCSEPGMAWLQKGTKTTATDREWAFEVWERMTEAGRRELPAVVYEEAMMSEEEWKKRQSKKGKERESDSVAKMDGGFARFLSCPSPSAGRLPRNGVNEGRKRANSLDYAALPSRQAERVSSTIASMVTEDERKLLAGNDTFGPGPSGHHKAAGRKRSGSVDGRVTPQSDRASEARSRASSTRSGEIGYLKEQNNKLADLVAAMRKELDEMKRQRQDSKWTPLREPTTPTQLEDDQDGDLDIGNAFKRLPALQTAQHRKSEDELRRRLGLLPLRSCEETDPSPTSKIPLIFAQGSKAPDRRAPQPPSTPFSARPRATFDQPNYASLRARARRPSTPSLLPQPTKLPTETASLGDLATHTPRSLTPPSGRSISVSTTRTQPSLGELSFRSIGGGQHHILYRRPVVHKTYRHRLRGRRSVANNNASRSRSVSGSRKSASCRSTSPGLTESTDVIERVREKMEVDVDKERRLELEKADGLLRKLAAAAAVESPATEEWSPATDDPAVLEIATMFQVMPALKRRSDSCLFSSQDLQGRQTQGAFHSKSGDKTQHASHERPGSAATNNTNINADETFLQVYESVLRKEAKATSTHSRQLYSPPPTHSRNSILDRLSLSNSMDDFDIFSQRNSKRSPHANPWTTYNCSKSRAFEREEDHSIEDIIGDYQRMPPSEPPSPVPSACSLPPTPLMQRRIRSPAPEILRLSSPQPLQIPFRSSSLIPRRTSSEDSRSGSARSGSGSASASGRSGKRSKSPRQRQSREIPPPVPQVPLNAHEMSGMGVKKRLSSINVDEMVGNGEFEGERSFRESFIGEKRSREIIEDDGSGGREDTTECRTVTGSTSANGKITGESPTARLSVSMPGAFVL
ncbi:hypothetical protein K402DRAFT_404838 [Aulographum hederae CBS 113979]|uniref:Uncharacterized protein n=1 Tax=Aulographum hederae CBS 113979 TaxID=1176131 RepID=A0A6G1GYR6_9PEZI|nr:hypothetical protein K402DRAFT_404838 [Aulographum hederae CBS 113979]